MTKLLINVIGSRCKNVGTLLLGKTCAHYQIEHNITTDSQSYIPVCHWFKDDVPFDSKSLLVPVADSSRV